MNKDIFSAIKRRDETKPFAFAEPFYQTFNS